MSADREMDHLEMMTDMSSSRHYNQPYCYAEAEPDEPEPDTEEAYWRAKLGLKARPE